MSSRLSFLAILFAFSMITARDVLGAFVALVIFALASYFWLQSKAENFTVDDMFWICIIVFFGVVPAQTIDNGFFYESGATVGIQYATADFLIALLFISLFLIAFFLPSRIFVNSSDIDLAQITPRKSLSNEAVLLLFLLSILSFVFYVIFSGGVGVITSSRLEKELLDPQGSFIAVFFLACLVISASLISQEIADDKSPGIICWSTFFCSIGFLLVAVNIYNSPRFFIVASWTPVMFALFSRYLSFSKVAVLILVGLFLLMPLMSITSRFGADEVIDYDQIFSDVFRIKDVDIYETAVHSVDFLRDGGYLLGDNIKAILLFFVPRDFWPEKPYVGGIIVGRELYGMKAASTDNLSYFIGSDLYLDFGIFGVIIGGLVLGFFYSRLLSTNQSSNFLVLYVVIGALPILIRGPVGAVIGYPLCLLIVSRYLPTIFRRYF